MRRLALLAVLLFVGCRRTHETPTVERFTLKGAPPTPPPIGGAPEWVPPLPPPPRAPARPPVPDASVTDGGDEIGDGGSVNGHVNGPRADALNRVVKSAEPSLRACLDGADLAPGAAVAVNVSYRILPDGKTADVEVSATAPKETVECLRATAASLRFPTFEGEPVSGSFPYAYRRR